MYRFTDAGETRSSRAISRWLMPRAAIRFTTSDRCCRTSSAAVARCPHSSPHSLNSKARKLPSRFPISNELGRFARALVRSEGPEDDPRAIHRFRRATEPWALEALAFLGASELAPAIERARSSDPPEPLLRGDELELPPGPEIGRLLAEIEEERAVGTISTKEEALDYARRHSGAFREDS